MAHKYWKQKLPSVLPFLGWPTPFNPKKVKSKCPIKSYYIIYTVWLKCCHPCPPPGLE